jgi:hypothetical protein
MSLLGLRISLQRRLADSGHIDHLFEVMAGLVPAIHVSARKNTWMRATSAGMTGLSDARHRTSSRHFDLRYGVLTIHLLGVELDFIARFDGLEHRGILCLVDHGHAALHSEPLGRAMLDRDLARGLIDLHDLPVDQIRLSTSVLRSNAEREREDERWSLSHAFSFPVC